MYIVLENGKGVIFLKEMIGCGNYLQNPTGEEKKNKLTNQLLYNLVMLIIKMIQIHIRNTGGFFRFGFERVY